MISDSAWANSRNGWVSVLRRPEAMWIPPNPTGESEDESNEDSKGSQSSEHDDGDEYDDEDEDEENMKSPTPQKTRTVIEERFPPPPSQYPLGVRSWRMKAKLSVPWPEYEYETDDEYDDFEPVLLFKEFPKAVTSAVHENTPETEVEVKGPADTNYETSTNSIQPQSIISGTSEGNKEKENRKAEPVVHVGEAIQQSSAPACTEGHDTFVIDPVEASPAPEMVQGSVLPPVTKEKEPSSLGVTLHGLSVKAPVVDHPQGIKFKNEKFLRLYHEMSSHIDTKDHMGERSVNEGPVIEHHPVVPPSDTVQVLFHNCLPKKAPEVDTYSPLSASDSLPVSENQNNKMPLERVKRKLESMNDGHNNAEVRPATKRTSTCAIASVLGSSFQNAISIDDDTDDPLTPAKAAQTYSNPVAQETQDFSNLVSSPPMPIADRETLNMNRLEQRLRLKGVFNHTIGGRVQKISNQHHTLGSSIITGANGGNRAGSSRLLATLPSSGYVILEPSTDTAAPSESNNTSTESVDPNSFRNSRLEMD
ncbi:uncharacterized protein LAJ45_00963 [Morchella importuna]|uniref:uncharacterized protein n=1 Tax=Morchella importuna TaxID=1174673 RepID=UPI001E8DCB74|nr:uncharacterized protein LAJ45_00963 [Morchella importuna]KAH8154436.1 hypothetical protein LAJ45_00963 [Morchella importuna]